MSNRCFAWKAAVLDSREAHATCAWRFIATGGRFCATHPESKVTGGQRIRCVRDPAAGGDRDRWGLVAPPLARQGWRGSGSSDRGERRSPAPVDELDGGGTADARPATGIDPRLGGGLVEGRRCVSRHFR